MKYRFDRSPLKVTLTDEGYLIDNPIVGRTGIQIYMNADGSIRRELRLAEDVFDAASLASFAGKPVTDDHPEEMVTADNHKALSVGFVQSAGVQDGENVRAQIMITDAATIKKIMSKDKQELSLGYYVEHDETAGEWNGQKYDAIQKNIRINHLAVVKRGRAGNARLNVDAAEVAIFEDEVIMPKVLLDNGLEYEAAPEVAVEIGRLKESVKSAQKQLDSMTAERDMLKSKAVDVEKVKREAMDAALKQLKDRAELEAKAKEFEVKTDGLNDRQVREAVIKSVNDAAVFDGKSDDYVQAAFDMAVQMGQKLDSLSVQRQTVASLDSAPAQKTLLQELAERSKKVGK